jgi:hypothetical protein
LGCPISVNLSLEDIMEGGRDDNEVLGDGSSVTKLIPWAAIGGVEVSHLAAVLGVAAVINIGVPLGVIGILCSDHHEIAVGRNKGAKLGTAIQAASLDGGPVDGGRPGAINPTGAVIDVNRAGAILL